MLPVLAGRCCWPGCPRLAPAYLETMLQLGLALVGIDAIAAEPKNSAAKPFPPPLLNKLSRASARAAWLR